MTEITAASGIPLDGGGTQAEPPGPLTPSGNSGGTTIASGAPVTYWIGINNMTEEEAAKARTNFSYVGEWKDGGSNNWVWKIKPLSYYINPLASATIRDGKVTIKLGVPKDESLGGFTWEIEDGTVTPRNAKMKRLTVISTADGKYQLDCYKDTANYAQLMYADRDVTIKGTFTDPADSDSDWSYTYTYTYDVSLKKGWNYAITSFSETIVTITASTTLPSGFNWTVNRSAEE